MLWVGREMNPLCYRPQSRCAPYRMHCATCVFCALCNLLSRFASSRFTWEAVPNPVPSLPSGRNKPTAFQTYFAYISSTDTTPTYWGNLSLSGTKAWLSEFFFRDFYDVRQNEKLPHFFQKSGKYITWIANLSINSFVNCESKINQ